MGTATAAPMSTAQSDFISDLVVKRDVPDEVKEALDAVFGGLSKPEASAWIRTLKTFPVKAATPQAEISPVDAIPAGHYVVDFDVLDQQPMAFYRVWRPKDNLTGPGPYALYREVAGHGTRIKGADARKVFEAIAAVGAEAAAKRYGHETGSCSSCGRKLTDPDSIAAGIGPVCAKKNGWGF